MSWRYLSLCDKTPALKHKRKETLGIWLIAFGGEGKRGTSSPKQANTWESYVDWPSSLVAGIHDEENYIESIQGPGFGWLIWRTISDGWIKWTQPTNTRQIESLYSFIGVKQSWNRRDSRVSTMEGDCYKALNAPRYRRRDHWAEVTVNEMEGNSTTAGGSYPKAWGPDSSNAGVMGWLQKNGLNQNSIDWETHSSLDITRFRSLKQWGEIKP